MSSITLNTDQKELLVKLKDWWTRRYRQYFVYSGAAGTGKTTVMLEFIEELGLDYNEYICAALIGKAVLVMLKKGLPAKTIHSLIYNYIFQSRGDGTSEFTFQLKDDLDKYLKLLIIDESSFVTDSIKNDILSFGLPAIFTGDMNQLPPPFGSSSILEEPDHILHQLMRQKEGDMIVQFAANFLLGKRIPVGDYGNCRMLDEFEMGRNLLDDYDVIICSLNRTRELINQYIRYEILNTGGSKVPYVGEKMICRDNKWGIMLGDFSLTNGTVGTVTSIEPPKKRQAKLYTRFDFKPDYIEGNQCFHDLRLDLKYLNLPFDERKTYNSLFKQEIKFEFANAITAHLSQGSEYPRVLFIQEPGFSYETHCRLEYTAATRAINQLDVLTFDGLIRNKDLIAFNRHYKICN